MEDSVVAKEVKFNNKRRLGRGGHLDELAPVRNDLLSGGGLELLVAAGDLLALHPDPGHDVPLQHLDQLLLVAHQLVQGVDRDLVKGGIGRGEDGEGPLGGESLHHAGGLEGCVQGGEVLILSDQSRHALAAEGHSRLLGLLGGPGLRDEVRVGPAEMRDRAGNRGAVREVVMETTDGTGHIAQHLLSLGQQQGA